MIIRGIAPLIRVFGKARIWGAPGMWEIHGVVFRHGPFFVQVNRTKIDLEFMARVCTYLNFAGNTMEAFEFYREVFGGDFIGGIARFSDIPLSGDDPPFPDGTEDMIMHIELPILGGHILMGTDAPESMGFHLRDGNKVHIQLEPDSEEETRRIFGKLSEGGTVTMELQVMFWNALYGTCTDRYGIQWMVNHPLH